MAAPPVCGLSCQRHRPIADVPTREALRASKRETPPKMRPPEAQASVGRGQTTRLRGGTCTEGNLLSGPVRTANRVIPPSPSPPLRLSLVRAPPHLRTPRPAGWDLLRATVDDQGAEEPPPPGALRFHGFLRVFPSC